jgi:hypothetical protein
METNPSKNKKNKNTSKKDFKSLPINTQIKLENNALITEYNYFTSIDEKWLPITKIIEYMKKEYLPFEQQLNEIRKNGDELSLNDFFIIPNELMIPQKKCSFETNLKQNPNMSFDKFVSIVDWILSNNRIIIYNKSSPISAITTGIKNQVNKDITRTPLIEINNEIYFDIKKDIDKFSFDFEDTYKNTDLFNNKIMDVMKNQGIKIDFNNINITDILVQQNIANLLQMNINLFIGKKIAPENVFDYKFDRNIQFFLTKEEQYILLNFTSQLLFTKQGEIITTPCGNYSCTLRIDLKNKNYSLENFILNYDIDSCVDSGVEEAQSIMSSNNLQPTVTNSENISQPSSLTNSVNKYKNKAYNLINNNKGTIAAGVAASGVASVGALYLAGILGGKSNNFTSKQRKRIKQNKKNKKSNKFTNIRIKKIKTKKHFYNDVKKKKINKTKRNK